MAAYTDEQFNDAAKKYLSGNLRNVANSMTGKPVEPVKPWFGEGGTLADLNSGRYGQKAAPSPTPTATPSPVTPQAAPAAPASKAVQAAPQAVIGKQMSRYDFDMRQHLANNAMQSAPAQGQPQLSSGTMGQDGYGQMTLNGTLPKPGSTFLNYGDPRRPGEYQTNAANLAKYGRGMTGTVTDKNTGLSFQGSAEDAAKFFDPRFNTSRARTPTPQQQVAVEQPVVNTLSMPIATPPVYGAHGGGWKTRRDLYKADLAAYSAATGQQMDANIAQMRENGAGRRAIMEAERWNGQDQLARDRYDLDAERYQGEKALNKLNQDKGSLELEQAQQLQALQQQWAAEQDPAKKRALRDQISMLRQESQTKPDVRMMKVPNPENDLGEPTEAPVTINADGSYTVMNRTNANGETPATPMPKNEKDLVSGKTYVNGQGVQYFFDGKGLRKI